MTDGMHGLIDIVMLEIIHGSVPRREIKDALEWALGNRTLLLAKFKVRIPMKFKEYNQ